MAVNRFSNLSTSSFKPLDLNTIMAVPLAKQAQHDAAQASADEYSALQAQSLSQDSEAVNARLNELRGKSDAISQQLLEKGVDRDLQRQLRELKREKEKEYGQEGLIGNAQANYKSAMSFVNDLATKKEQQAGWSPAQAKAWAQQQVGAFQGSRNEDGTFNTFQGKGLSTKIDRNQWIIDNIKNVAADTLPQGLRNYMGDDGKLSLPMFQYALQSGSIEEKTLNKIMSSLSVAAAANPDLKASLLQEAAFTGEDPKEALDFGQVVIEKDKNGKNKHVWKPGKSSFGRELYGLAYGAQYKNIDTKYTFPEDKVGFSLYKSGLPANETEELIRAANSDVNTIRPDNFESIKSNNKLALIELDNQQLRVDNILKDRKSKGLNMDQIKEDREYKQALSDLNDDKIKFYNLDHKLKGIEKKAYEALSSRDKEVKKVLDDIDNYDDIESLMKKKGLDFVKVEFNDKPSLMSTKDYNAMKRIEESIAKKENYKRLFDSYNIKMDENFNSDNAEYVLGELRNKTKSLMTNYLTNNPYSEGYDEFTGLSAGKAAGEVGFMNKNLSETFNGSGYSEAYSGIDMNSYILNTYGNEDIEIEPEIRVTNGFDEMGFPIEHLIIKDKGTGAVLETKAVTRGQNGVPEMRRLSKSLMNSGDPDLISKGEQLMVNITYMPEIKKSGIRSGGDSGIINKKFKNNETGAEIFPQWNKISNPETGRDSWKVTVDGVVSPVLFGENEIANWLAKLSTGEIE